MNPSYQKKEKNRRFAAEQEREMPENMVIGRNAVRELLAGGRDIDKIYVQSGEREGSIKQLIGIAAARKIPILETERTKLDVMSLHGAHQGIIALAAEQNYATVDEILAYAQSRGEKPFLIMCDGVEDPHNLGAILRSAECCGAHGVIIPKRRNVGLTPVVAKSSAGAIEHIKVAKVVNLASIIEELKEKGVWFFAADMDGDPYDKTDFTSPLCLVMGGEGAGVSRLVKQSCDAVVSIPLYGQVNSMNVSCAAAVLLAEAARQRNRLGR